MGKVIQMQSKAELVEELRRAYTSGDVEKTRLLTIKYTRRFLRPSQSKTDELPEKPF